LCTRKWINNYNNKQGGGKEMFCAVIRLPLVSETQLTPLYSKAADIAMLYHKAENHLIDAVNRV
jgi:hypothetical protein